MKRKKRLSIVLLLIVLVAALIGGGLYFMEAKRKSRVLSITSRVFDTPAYVAGAALEAYVTETALMGRDLSRLLADGTDISSDEVLFSGPQNVTLPAFSAEAFPGPYAVLLVTAEGREPVFVRVDGIDTAESLADAATLIVVERSELKKSGGYYCVFRPYAVTRSGKYWLRGEKKIQSETTADGIKKAVESLGCAAPGTENPLEKYAANLERVRSFDFMAMIDTARPAEGSENVEYAVEENTTSSSDAAVMPCYDLTAGEWRHGEFMLNSDMPLCFMTSEVIGEVQIAGTYAVIGTAYVPLYRIRIYDCDAGTFEELEWHPSAEARDAVGGSHPSGSWPPFVYYCRKGA